MCGILSVVNFKNSISGTNLAVGTAVIRHRGPDDEGFLTWAPGEQPEIWAGNDTSDSTRSYWNYKPLRPDQFFKVGFGHRRLSILDLSPMGHQPMNYAKAGLAITFNGEIYNYLEIKSELERLGHAFKSTSDTEVILHAWEEWGPDCLNDFNGMFSLVVLDYNNQELYAVRDRFGVKPLYYYKNSNGIVFASEIKQIRTMPGYQFSLNETISRQFLATGATEHTDNTFDTQIKQLPGGHYLHMDLSAADGDFDIVKWYTLEPHKWHGSFEDAAGRFRELLADAVNLRLRSDVKVGSCLSGGLDSSSIVCLMANLLNERGDHSGQETVTACFEHAKYDEWQFASEVVQKAGAHPHRTFPAFSQLREDIDKIIWHQDEPVGSTSVFSQWEVFKASRKAGLKVMIDGQGADEQLAGYGGHDLSFYAGLLHHAHFADLWEEAVAYKKEKGSWPVGFILNAWKLNRGKTFPMPMTDWLQNAEPATIHKQPAKSLQENLLRQLYGEPLPALLRYEDRNSMAWSVESRTPFMDYRLVEFNLGLPERFVYKNGERKTILRKAMRNIIPDAIADRKDKMGFVTPEEMWLKGEGREWFTEGTENALKQFGGSLLNVAATRSHVQEMMEGKRKFGFMPWRLVSFVKWYEMMSK